MSNFKLLNFVRRNEEIKIYTCKGIEMCLSFCLSLYLSLSLSHSPQGRLGFEPYTLVILLRQFTL